MKITKIRYVLPVLAMFIAGTTILPSCKKSETTVTAAADVTALTAAITTANALYAGTVEGTKPGFYTVGSKATFQTSINQAISVQKSGTSDASKITNALAQLNVAMSTFQGKLLQEVSVANLVAYWKFDGNANDATPNGNNGTLQSGLVGIAPGTDGNTLPVLIADRFAQANMAYEFANGANIEVPYKLALNPSAITISMWVKCYETRPDNYLISLNRWHGYKFQLQEANKVFFTTQLPNEGNNEVYFNQDSETGVVPLNTWTHIAVSYAIGSAKFYINGELKREWTTNATAAVKIPAIPLNLCIGNQYPKGTPHGVTVPENPNQYYGDFATSGFFFHGAMDDVRIYKKALTDAEVNSVYTFELTK